MRKYYKILILITFLAFSITTVSANAVGYTYSHSGKPIYSTVGLSVSADGIYTVISDAWINKSGDRLPVNRFKSPEDLFVYTEKDQSGNSKDIIYVVDSDSNNLFVFDGNLNYQYRVNQFEIRPEDFTEEEILKINTNQKTDSDSDADKQSKTIKFTDYLSKKGFSLHEFFAVAEISYDERTDDQKFYLSCNTLSGVYRAIRPARDKNGVIIKDAVQDLIYLSDKNNNQIVIVDANTYKVVQVVSAPTNISFSGKKFLPVKLVTDVTGRLFVISEGVYEGIMQMSYFGEFSSFVGVNYVTLTFWQTLWKKFLTEEQIKKQDTIINTIFTSIAIDDEGFIYTTSRAINDVDDTKMIKRINPSGKDVLTRNGYHVPKGDLEYIRTGTDTSLRGPSRFTSITINDYGVYTVADGKSGRLFTYDDEGNLLYISAGKGNELDNLNTPVAIRYHGESILALDKTNKAILRYKPTEIGAAINKAVKYHYQGNLVASSEEWKNVVAKNPNYEFAYVGIGKSLLNEGRYTEAMNYFQTGYNVTYYSRAYKLYRDQQVEKYFTPFMWVLLISGFTYVGYKTYVKVRYRKLKDTEMGDDDE